MHPLTLLCVALGWNYARHKRDQSTICSVTREHIPWPLFLTGWAALTAWIVPHWLLPVLRKRKQ